jgi:alkanesulfonate monooxygenase SsuD/methylene tetrahydromethanopterin reductase-like flavin-dependent oxidoreductase (luciferase family)
MKVGVQTGFSGATSPELIADFGQIAEERGFHSIWVPAPTRLTERSPGTPTA